MDINAELEKDWPDLSKLSRLEDIEYELDGLNGELYGTVYTFMARYSLS